MNDILLEHENCIIKALPRQFSVLVETKNRETFNRMVLVTWFGVVIADYPKITIQANDKIGYDALLAQIEMAKMILAVDNAAREQGEQPIYSFEDIRSGNIE